MKQTVSILTALMITLLLVSGFIVMGSMQQSEMLIEREEQLLEKTVEWQKANAKIAEMEKEAKDNQQLLEKTKQERDALSAQLNDALLSSQESNEAVHQQVQLVQNLETANDQLAHQLSLKDQKITQLETELEKALMPTLTPSPLRVERVVQPKR